MHVRMQVCCRTISLLSLSLVCIINVYNHGLLDDNEVKFRKNVSLGYFVIVGPSESALPQTWMVQPPTHLGIWCNLLLRGYNLHSKTVGG